MRRWLAARRAPIWLLPRLYAVDVRELAYRQVDGQDLLARVYRPVDVPAFAAVLQVHGGNWTSDDRFQQQTLDRSLAASGVLVAAIDYRLAPAYPFPAAVEDVGIAADWLRQHAAELGARADAPVGAMGNSAGGHLVLLSALAAEVQFVIADAPVSDPVADLAERSAGQHPFWTEPELAMQGSPLALVQSGKARALPPLLVAHGNRDDLVPVSMSRRFVEAYRAAGGSAELHVFGGLGHVFMLRTPRSRQARELAQRMLAFIMAQASPI